MKHDKRQISVLAGTLVEGSQSGQVTLKGDVYVEAIREVNGCWLYGEDDPRAESWRCAGASAAHLATLRPRERETR